MKSPWISLRIDWILKIMVQFCYLRLYLGTVTVSCHLLQRMARMEMDWDLKQLGQLFRVLMPFLQNSPPKISCFIPPDEICLITFFTTLQENQVPVGVVFTQAPYYSPHCFHQKAKHQNKTKKQTKKDIFSFCGLLGALWGGTDFRTLPTSRPRPQVFSLPLSLIDTLRTRLFHCEEIKFFNRFYCDYSIIFFKCGRIYHMTKLVPWWFRSS